VRVFLAHKLRVSGFERGFESPNGARFALGITQVASAPAKDHAKYGALWRLRVTGLLAANASIQVRAVEFDGIAVWVNDVDLRVACGGVGTKLHFLQVVVRNVVAETFAAQRR
jgi:hypothetical protein